MDNQHKFANGLNSYGIIHAKHLPHAVSEELTELCYVNDTGQIVNPNYHPEFKQWLSEVGMEIRPYIVWWSW